LSEGSKVARAFLGRARRAGASAGTGANAQYDRA